jgi:hypothetical protein
MDMPHMKTLYDIGRLSEIIAVADNSDGNWHLDCHDLWGHTLHLTSTSGKALHFSNLDEASAVAKNIGFEQVQIVEH